MKRQIGAELVARLKAMNDANEQPCPYVTGTVTQHCTLTPFTLTDAEREAISRVYDLLCDRARELQSATRLDEARPLIQWSQTLRGLWERLSGSAAISGAGKSAPAANAPPTLTDEERQAISAAACICEDAGRTDIAIIINTALERLG